MNSDLSNSLGMLETIRTEISRMADAELADELLSPVPGVAPNSVQCSHAVFETAPRPFGECITGPVLRSLAVAVELLTRILIRKMQDRPLLDRPEIVKEWLGLKFASLDHEVFAVMFLDASHRLITFEELFRGTVNQISVWPREIVKAALAWGAHAVIVCHNHPSCQAEQSRSDENITLSIRNALALVDIKLLDHFVVAGMEVVSFAERGLL